MSRNNRVLVLIAAMAVSSFGVGGLVYALTTSEGAAINASGARLDRLDRLAGASATNLDTEEGALDDYVLSRSPAALARFNAAVARETAAADEFRTRAAGQAPIIAALEALASTSAVWRAEIAAPAIRAIQTHDLAAIATFASQAADDRAPIEAAIVALDTELARARDELDDRRADVDTTTIVGSIIAFSVLIVAFGVALVAVRRFGHALERDARDASLLNRFTEVASFAIEDSEVATANLVALGRLAGPDASVMHILNRSMDRAVPEAWTGDAVRDVLPLHALGRCAGIVRGTMYVTDDLSDELSVHCPIYPAQQGTLVCLPLISGETVGAVHLWWRTANALPLARRSSIARIAEHAALAIGNRRLLAALHGQANTDARTGLPNSRAFDLALEGALAARAPDAPLAVLMIDIDQFKQFNDNHGHPAGDEALRAFAEVLRSSMREGDVAARYGGEEFAVYLPGVDSLGAAAIGERIRLRTEATIISLAPGISDRITISVGVASAPAEGHDRVALLRLADEALYSAKAAGRNRVGVASVPRTRDQTGPPNALAS